MFTKRTRNQLEPQQGLFRNCSQDLIKQIIRLLDINDRKKLSQVSKFFHQEICSAYYWKNDIQLLGVKPDLLAKLLSLNLVTDFKTLYGTLSCRLKKEAVKELLTVWELLALSAEPQAIQTGYKKGLIKADARNKFGNSPLELIMLSLQLRNYYLLSDVERAEVLALFKNLNATSDDKISVMNHQGLNCLHVAARTGNPQIVQLALDMQIDPNALTPSNETALHFAALSGNVECIEILKAKTNLELQTIKTAFGTLLHYAALSGKVSAIEAIIANDDFNIIEINNEYEDIRHLTARSGSIEAFKYAISICAKQGLETNEDFLYYILPGAVERGHVDIVDYIATELLQIDNDLYGQLYPIGFPFFEHNEEYDGNLLHYAASFGHVEVVKCLINHGFIPEETMGVNEHEFDLNIFTVAAIYNHVEVLKYCKELGLQPISALAWAPRSFAYEAMEFLVNECGMNPNKTDENDHTIIHELFQRVCDYVTINDPAFNDKVVVAIKYSILLGADPMSTNSSKVNCLLDLLKNTRDRLEGNELPDEMLPLFEKIIKTFQDLGFSKMFTQMDEEDQDVYTVIRSLGRNAPKLLDLLPKGSSQDNGLSR